MVSEINSLLNGKKIIFSLLFVFSLFVLLLPFQDTVLSNSPLRFLGKSPSFIFLIFFTFLYALRAGFNKSFGLVLSYVLLMSLISFLSYYGGIVYGRELNEKGLNLFILNFILFLPFLFVMREGFFSKKMREMVLLSFFICFIGIFLVDIFHFKFFTMGFFHVKSIDQLRPRGFSYEPSMLAISIITLYLCSVCLLRRKIIFFDLFILFVLSFFIQSKGGILCLLVAAIAFFTFSKKKNSVFLIFSFIFIFSSFCFLMSLFLVDFERFTSTITRGTLVLVPIISLIHHPLGVGYFGFLDSFHTYLPEAISISKKYIDNEYGYREIERYLVASNDGAIGAKSFFLNNVIVFGWPFVVMYFYIFFKAIKLCKMFFRKDLEFLIWFLFLSLTLFVEGVGLYVFSLGFLVFRSEVVFEKNKEFKYE